MARHEELLSKRVEAIRVCTSISFASNLLFLLPTTVLEKPVLRGLLQKLILGVSIRSHNFVNFLAHGSKVLFQAGCGAVTVLEAVSG